MYLSYHYLYTSFHIYKRYLFILIFSSIYKRILNVIFLVLTIASLESARKCAADSTYETADEEQLGRGKRQHISYNPYGDDEEEEDEADNPVPRKNAKSKNITILYVSIDQF